MSRRRQSRLRRFAKWTALALLTIVLIALVAPWWVVARDWITRGEFAPWLEANVRALDLGRPEAGLSFDDDFYRNRVFLLGEIHGAAKAQTLDLAMMKHLNRRAGVRWIMAELDYSQAERFNAYLDSGDESLVLPVFEAWLDESAQWGNRQHLEKLRALREYNRTLPRERRLRYFGVDRIHDVDTAADWLGGMLVGLDRDAPEPLRRLEAVLDVGWTNDAALADALRAASKTLDAAEPARVVGIDAPGVRHLALNLLRAVEGDGRYAIILDNVDAMVGDFGIGDEEPLYGFWGIFHALQATVNDGAQPLALRLQNSELPFAGHVASIAMVYIDSEWNLPARMLPQAARPDARYIDVPLTQANPYLQYLKGIGHLRRAAGDADVALFRLTGRSSPYPSDGQLVNQSGLLMRVFQFEVEVADRMPTGHLILIRDSPAVDPYR